MGVSAVCFGAEHSMSAQRWQEMRLNRSKHYTFTTVMVNDYLELQHF